MCGSGAYMYKCVPLLKLPVFNCCVKMVFWWSTPTQYNTYNTFIYLLWLDCNSFYISAVNLHRVGWLFEKYMTSSVIMKAWITVIHNVLMLIVYAHVMLISYMATHKKKLVQSRDFAMCFYGSFCLFDCSVAGCVFLWLAPVPMCLNENITNVCSETTGLEIYN